MQFSIRELESLEDGGKNLCVWSSSFSKEILSYPSTHFKKFSQRTYYYWLVNRRPIPIETINKIMKSKKIKNIEVDYFSVAGGNKIKTPNEESIALYYLLGVILGDGCLVHRRRGINKSTYSLQIACQYRSYASYIQYTIKNLFSINAPIYFSKGSHTVFVFSKPLVRVLHKRYQVPIGQKYEKLKAPLMTFRSSDNQIRAFLKGIFDADGNLYIHKRKEAVQIRQKSKGFIEDLYKLLNLVKIPFRPPYYDRANNSWVLWSSKQQTVKLFKSKIINLKI